MSVLRLLDLFAGAGGAGMGYHRAWFRVTGIDHRPQPNYPFSLIQADALDYLETALDKRGSVGYDAIHASPPCQHYSQATAWRGSRSSHPDLIVRTRELLEAAGVPYVIENVEGARRHLRNPLMLCGSTFGLPVQRHRYFEANWPLSIMALGAGMNPCSPSSTGRSGPTLTRWAACG